MTMKKIENVPVGHSCKEPFHPGAVSPANVYWREVEVVYHDRDKGVTRVKNISAHDIDSGETPTHEIKHGKKVRYYATLNKSIISGENGFRTRVDYGEGQ